MPEPQDPALAGDRTGLTARLTEGELRKAVLILERAGRAEIAFRIDPPAGMDGMDHSRMGHGDHDG